MILTPVTKKSFWTLCLLTAVAMPTLPAEPVSVTLLLKDGKRRIGYVANSNDKGLLFQATPEGSGTGIPFTDLRGVAFTDEGDLMGPARYSYSRSNYEEAAKLFDEVANDYEMIWGIGRDLLGNFACEARFFHIDCLRRLGRYTEIAAAMATKTGQNLENGIAEVHLPMLKVFRLWSSYAQGDWDALTGGLKEYESPLSGKEAELLKTPSFADHDPNLQVQFYFMRGKMYQAQNRPVDALNDFYRAALLDYGADRQLAAGALEAALTLQAAAPDIAENQNKQMEIFGVSTVFRDSYNGGDIPLRFQDFTREPELLKKRRLEDQELQKEAAALRAEEAKKAAEEAEAAKAAEAEKGKGKGKSKGKK